MWCLRIFIGQWCGKVYADAIEEGLGILMSDNADKIDGPLTHQPATRTIYYNGNPIGCYYWD